jgi:cell wall-associated NlpC family hydrolase
VSVAEAMASVQAIQTRIAALSGAPSKSQATTGGSASAAVFADALAGTTHTSPALLGGGTVTGEDVAAAAQKYVGVPYVLGGTTSSGIDCSGLVQRTFADLGVDVPRLVHEQEKIGTEVHSLAEAKPGDLIVMNGGDHIAIYLGDNTVVHAPYEGRDVSVQRLWVGDDQIDTIRRVVPSEAVSASPPSLSALLGTSGSDPLSSILSGSSAGDSPSSLSSLSSLIGGASGMNASTLQQLVAARSALLSGSVS